MASAGHPTGERREGVDVGMLAVAALAAAAAAVVTSKLWPGGTLLSTAMTPVIVTLVKEWLRKPAERISAVSAKAPRVAARVVSPSRGDRRPGASAGHPGARREPAGRSFDEPAPPSVPPAQEEDRVVPAPGSPAAGVPPEETFVEPAPGVVPSGYRLYQRHKIRWRLALVTGVLAFGVGVVVLTVPELVLGGAVAGKGGTTVFGGGSSSSSQDKAHDQESGAKRSDQPGAKPGKQQPSAKPSSTSPRPSKKPPGPASTTPKPSPSSPKPPSSSTPQSTTPAPPPSTSPTPPPQSPAPAPAPAQ